MIKVHDLNRGGKMLTGNVPDPLGSIANDDFSEGQARASIPGFQIDPVAKLGGGFDGAGIGGGARIADGVASLILCCLRENTAEFGFASVSGLAGSLALAAFGLAFHSGQSRSVHLDV